MFCIVSFMLLFNSVSYVFLLLCLCILIVMYVSSVYSVFVVPTGTLQLPWLRFFLAFSSVVRQMPGYNSQRQGTARTLPKLIVLFCVLFVCKCVLYYCRWVSTHLQITNIYIHEPRKTKYKRLRQSADYSLLRLTLCQCVRCYPTYCNISEDLHFWSHSCKNIRCYII